MRLLGEKSSNMVYIIYGIETLNHCDFAQSYETPVTIIYKKKII